VVSEHRAIVTGGSRGIGRAVVERLAADGSQVVTCGRGEQPSDLPPGVSWVRADVAQPSEAAHLVAEALDRLGGVSLLVNNAGVQVTKTVVESTDDDWDQVVGTNCRGVFNLCRALIPEMAEHGGYRARPGPRQAGGDVPSSGGPARHPRGRRPRGGLARLRRGVVRDGAAVRRRRGSDRRDAGATGPGRGLAFERLRPAVDARARPVLHSQRHCAYYGMRRIMRNKARATETTVRLLGQTRYEVLPTASIEDKVLEHVPLERVLTVTASPNKGLEPTLDLSERLTGHGYTVVPHLAARMVRDRSQLSEICDRLVGKGITRVFVPGGDADPPGGYADALSLLEDLAALGNPFSQVGITGYPESHPTITDDVTIQSMWDKRRFATHVVSNLTFDPAVLAAWVHRMRARGISMPLLLGLPGPVDRAKLLTMAGKIGVGESTRFLAKHKGTFARLAAPGGFTGEKFLMKCAAALSAPESGLEGLHVFTFNQVAETERWHRELLERLTTRR
jgi:methylenetetrahydrofolate reductase (NADPH)